MKFACSWAAKVTLMLLTTAIVPLSCGKDSGYGANHLDAGTSSGTGGSGGAPESLCDAGQPMSCGMPNPPCQGGEVWCDIWLTGCVILLQAVPTARAANFLAIAVNCVEVSPVDHDGGSSGWSYDSNSNSITLQGAACDLLKQQGTIRLDAATGGDSFSPPWCATATIHFARGDAGTDGG